MTSVLDESRGLVTLDDRYDREDGTVYVTGIQSLVRTLFDRARYDARLGHGTATYVSGYEGSPLAGFDLELARQKTRMRQLNIVHQPALNEELAATAVSGTQLVSRLGEPTARVTGVWYGKAPGLDRATDALRHANVVGTDPSGGAIALVGDDPSAKSSSVPCSSEFALADLVIPTLAPADAHDILDFGLHAVELSRASGLWTALKVSTVVADGACTANAPTLWAPPDLADLRSNGMTHSHQPSAQLLGSTLAALERSLYERRLPAVLEYIRRTTLNRCDGSGSARVGIVAAGATYLAMRQALAILGLDGEAELERAGIRTLKLGVVFPLEPSVIRSFAEDVGALVVVEDKRAFIEDAIKAILYGSRRQTPVLYGKHGPDGRPLFSPVGDNDADAIATALRSCLAALGIDGLRTPTRARERLTIATPKRTPFFCSGCPHNSSTEASSDTLVGAGIGCHAMLLLMPGQRSGEITGLTQMGGEGGHWIGMAPFAQHRHFVQNIGDGTFAHSGSLAVRAAVDAGVNITFKLLRNSAVAMTGGQRPVGEMTLRQVIGLLTAEGVRQIVVTTDEPRRVRREIGRGVDVRHRSELLDAQRELAAVDGVTVLIHEQKCAAEKRRKRKRGTAPAPSTRAFINERVCEGCGDCGSASNCLSVHPVQTPFGRKTRIDQSSCNLDFSCLDGDCPAFLTVAPRRPAEHPVERVDVPAEPVRPAAPDGFTIRITGIGGTGVVTIAQILATAAVIDGQHVRTLDQTGLAQKGGAVVSDLVISAAPWSRSPKLAVGECDLYLGCDALVAAEPANLRAANASRTVAVLSNAHVPTGEMVTDPAAEAGPAVISGALAAIHDASRAATVLDAAGVAMARVGHEQFANIVLTGAAYQLGTLPFSVESIERAIELNGVSVEANLAAFRWGRREVSAPTPAAADGTSAHVDLQGLAEELAAYQNVAYAERFVRQVDRVREREMDVTASPALTEAVARNLFKLMAYKDEYEVARLSLDPKLDDALSEQFGPGARHRYQLHPPILRALGMRRKIALGPWIRPVFRALVAMRRLRGTPFDPFGYAEVRRTERALVGEYLDVIDQVLNGLTSQNHSLATEIAELPDLIRGYENIKLNGVSRFRERAAEELARFRATTA